MDTPTRQHDCSNAISLTRLQLSVRETPVLSQDVPLVERTAWTALTQQLHSVHARTNGLDRDAALLVWTHGLVKYGGPTALDNDASCALLHEALSIGIRGGAFLALSDYCTSILLAGPLPFRGTASWPDQLGLYFKYVRLLKRRGRFSEALHLLGHIGSRHAASPHPHERTLNEARILLTVAKSLGSHQSRREQCLLFAKLAAKRAAPLRSIEDVSRQAANTWLRAIDVVSRSELQLRGMHRGNAPLGSKDQLFKQWKEAASLDATLGNRPSRVEFERLFALVSTAGTESERWSYRRGFLAALIQLNGAPPDHRGLAVRHSQYARILLDLGLPEEAGEHAVVALGYAEMVCDWQSIARALLQQSAALAAQKAGSRRTDPLQLSSLLERGKRTLQRLDEQPLSLLLSYCQEQARQYLIIGESKFAIHAIEEALAYVSSLRKALHADQYELKRDRSRGAERDASWQLLLTPILTEREQFNMRLSLGGDWELLSRTQEALIETLRTANQIAHRNASYENSFRRADYLRTAIYHTVQNVVSGALKGLRSEISQVPVSNEGPQLARIHHLLEDTEKRLRTMLTERTRGRPAPSQHCGIWHNISQLVAPDRDHLDNLTFFDPQVCVDQVIRETFELQADPESFREHFFNFLMNAAQQLATVPHDRPHVIEITVGWSREQMCGIVEVSDSAGRVQQLSKGLRAAHEVHAGGAAGTRQRGLSYVVTYFDEMWNCRISAEGQEGVQAKVILRFPQAVRVRRVEGD